MFHGVPGFSPYLPAVLYPTPMGQNDPKPAAPKTPKPDEGVSLRPGAKSGAKSASRKPRRGKKPSKPKQDEQEVEGQRSTEGEGQGSAAVSGVTQGSAVFEFYPQYKICSSESEFSDNEGGQASRLRQKCCSVRQNSLACLHSTIKVRKTLKIKTVNFLRPCSRRTPKKLWCIWYTQLVESGFHLCDFGCLETLGSINYAICHIPHQCLNQDLETGCLKLAVVKFWGDHNILIFQS